MKAGGFNLDLEAIGALLAVLILSFAAISIIRVAVYEQWASERIRSQGSIYAGEGLELDKSSIDWGVLYPSENKTVNVTATNTWLLYTKPAVLSIETANWDPTNASDYITLSWDYANQPVASSQSILLNLTLSVSPDISGITDFSFDIKINSQEKS